MIDEASLQGLVRVAEVIAQDQCGGFCHAHEVLLAATLIAAARHDCTADLKPPWAAAQILRVEVLTRRVIDPCCGTGALSKAARAAGYEVDSWDLHNWGYQGTEWIGRDFLTVEQVPPEFSVFMNPPFSLACEFVDHTRRLGARKILAFQRYAWRESDVRRRWWAKNPPARIWLCGDRATCWRFDIPPEDRVGGAATAHAWFVWEIGHKGAELGGAIYKSGGIE